MTYLVRRTCTEIGNEGTQDRRKCPSRPLEDFRAAAAYVLLGAPGAGKTKAFELESRECPDGRHVSARDFRTFDDRPEWRDATLFIDGLDEMRAGSSDGHTPLDRIRNRLDGLGRPRFRLSCRHADWFGASDRTHLERVSGDGTVTVLQLDPLSDEDIREILTWNHHVADPAAFVASARERGVEGLLDNPENLKMLAKAVTEGDWPETRKQTFELACRTLVLEPSQEHKTASRDRPDVSRLMDAAGRLCAVQLLGGRAGYALEGDASGDRDYPDLERVPGEDREVLRHTLGTRLFLSPPEGRTPEGRVTPAHRHTAEFLAARYLAGLIHDGLPLGRILALMTGHDGVVVSELRGLCAWLAAHSKQARGELIARDPLGAILYGDVRGFSIDEKRKLIDGIKREAKGNPWIFSMERSRLGDLATPDMAAVFERILTDPARDDAWQSLMAILLQAFVHGSVLPDLHSLMMQIVRDDTWKRGIRGFALDALIGRHEDGSEAAGELVILLEDIHAGSVSDTDDDLLGRLLIALYPTRLCVSDILRYLRAPRDPSFFGRYYSFWAREVPEKSTNAQRAELLDMLVERSTPLLSAFSSSPGQINPLRRVPLRLLRRLVESSQERISPHRLFAWLGLASHPELRASVEDRELFRSWLRNHPSEVKELIDFGLSHCGDSLNFHRCVHDMERRFFMMPLSARFGHWFLEKATTASDPDIAEYSILRVADAVHPHPSEHSPSRQEVVQRLSGHNELLRLFNQRLAFLEQNDAQQQHIQENDDEEKRQRRQEWRDHIRAHEGALRENRGRPELLNQMAMAWFGLYVDVDGDTPQDRIQDLVGKDDHLIRTILDGLRGSIGRDDLPGESEILDLGARNQRHPLALPYMAGLEEAVWSEPNGEAALDERQMRLALAIHYVVRIPRSPTWLGQVLDSHPDLVSDVLVRYMRSLMRSGADLSTALADLAHAKRYAAVARLACLPLLAAFPVRCTERQLRGLDHLIQAALVHCEAPPLLALIERKLARSSMNMGQRVSWLIAALVASPDTYLTRLETCVAGNERRVRRLARAAAEHERAPELIEGLGVPALELLIRLIGTSFRPWSCASSSGRVHLVTPEREASDFVSRLVDQLASNPSEDAARTLGRLSRDDDLNPWRFRIADAAHRQNALRREAGFRYCDIGRVLEVLDNQTPANAADLAALTSETLREIALNIRDGNTSDWRQYWNVDPHNRPLCPKPEDACRDALLSALQYRLQRLGIDATSEGRYADDRRADIRVAYGGFNVPVEIKKSRHRDLWRAIRAQLMAKYTRDLGAGGYGIYLVFWLGEADCLPPESGPRPKSAGELEARLRGMLSMDEAGKISVCVIDVEKPRT